MYKDDNSPIIAQLWRPGHRHLLAGRPNETHITTYGNKDSYSVFLLIYNDSFSLIGPTKVNASCLFRSPLWVATVGTHGLLFMHPACCMESPHRIRGLQVASALLEAFKEVCNVGLRVLKTIPIEVLLPALSIALFLPDVAFPKTREYELVNCMTFLPRPRHAQCSAHLGRPGLRETRETRSSKKNQIISEHTL